MIAVIRYAFVIATAFAFTHTAHAQAPDPAQLASDGFNAESKGDFTTALKDYRVAAMAGNVYAEGNLANMLATGRGTTKDPAEAMRWYQKAAAQNYPDAQFGIGSLYENGEGVKQDFGQAAKWYRTAADQGYAPAESALATLYAAGTGVQPDRVQAYMWYTLASGQDQTAKRRRDTLASRMKPEEVAQAEKMAKDFKPKEAAKK